jgi:hypothetical protein
MLYLAELHPQGALFPLSYRPQPGGIRTRDLPGTDARPIELLAVFLTREDSNLQPSVVEPMRFELMTSCMPCKRASAAPRPRAGPRATAGAGNGGDRLSPAFCDAHAMVLSNDAIDMHRRSSRLGDGRRD